MFHLSWKNMTEKISWKNLFQKPNLAEEIEEVERSPILCTSHEKEKGLI